MASEKHAAQIKHMKEHYQRVPINIRPEEYDALKAACAKNGTKPATVIRAFIKEYIEKNGEG